VSENGEAINFDACGSDFDTWLRIYNANGAEVASCDDCGDCDVQTNLTATGLRLDGNPHTLLVEGYLTSAGRYKAAAWFVPGPLLDRDRDREILTWMSVSAYETKS